MVKRSNPSGSSLPSQSGNSGKFLTTDGSTTSWGTPAGGGDDPVFYPAGESIKRNSGGTITEGGTAALDYIGSRKFPDSSENAMLFSCKVPTGKTGITSIKLVIMGDNVGGNAILTFQTVKADVVSGGATQNDLTDSETAYAIAADSNVQLVTVPSTAFNGLTAITADKIISVSVVRNAGSASDTHNTTLDILGLLIDWS